MKANPLRIFVEWALATSLLFSLYFFVQFYFRSHQIRAFQGQITQYQILESLAQDCLEYSKHNHDIDPILQSIGLRTVAPAPATTKAPGK